MRYKTNNMISRFVKRNGAMALLMILGGAAPTAFGATENFNGSLNSKEWVHFGPFDTSAGANLDATMTGSGDADLYVRAGLQPDTDNYDCRPYSGGSWETCSVAGGGLIYVSIKGYTTVPVFTLAVQYAAATPPPPPPPPPPTQGPTEISTDSLYYECADKPVDCTEQLIKAIKSTQGSADDTFVLRSGTYTIEHLDIDNNADISSFFNLQGEGKTNTIIKTNYFYLQGINSVSIGGIGFKGINNVDPGRNLESYTGHDFTYQGTSLLLVENASSLTFINNQIDGAAEDLLAVAGAGENALTDIVINDNDFRHSGLSGRFSLSNHNTFGQKKNRGRALILLNTKGEILRNNFTANTSSLFVQVTSGLNISKNIFNMYLGANSPLNDGEPVGSSFIYVSQETDDPFRNSNIEITENVFEDDHNASGIRINGFNHTVDGNTFTGSGTVAIKAHHLFDSTISNNIISLPVNSQTTGIQLEALSYLDEEEKKIFIGIRDVHISDNKIYNTSTGINATFMNYTDGNGILHEGGYANLYIYKNVILDVSYAAIMLDTNRTDSYMGDITEGKTGITQNTISNGSRSIFHFAVNLQNQGDLYIDNNWIYGEAWSGNYGHIRLLDVVKATIIKNSINSPYCVDYTYGGIILEETGDISIGNNSFSNLQDSAIHSVGNASWSQQEGTSLSYSDTVSGCGQ